MGVIDKLRHDEASFDSASTSAMLCYYTGGNNRITSKAVTDNCIGEEARTYSAANDTPSDVENNTINNIINKASYYAWPCR